ncbi:uncharacterized protein LOC131245086 [Magnolia sinica]|uniref:uncharacterized protein LOC131245086 n=1 Tax=Magnolia sinica TaxID=86752 RepID=UPI00265A7AD7|nr:uncharacterized protein LOC131245086 [Magnolia sinica]XP_058100284.1 uncharacterized protein LOC131245086 [Magnolia sinica]XP_058100286.1 uncharacterized protein LOC131245086 [Magnolia sinica]XP_058100287.1 uncharacterized protein LOC131245086 [Magnolia sinica]
MPAISASKSIIPKKAQSSFPPFFISAQCLSFSPSLCRKFPTCLQTLSPPPSSRKTLILCKSSETELSATDIEWLEKLPDRKKPLYSHSLPCIEAWLKKLGFYQSREDRAVWFVEKPNWHAQLSLDVTDLYIRYLKSGPGDLEKDIERRFSYALSREDIENAILGGP